MEDFKSFLHSYINANEKQELKNLLEKLREFKMSLNLENLDEFNSLISKIESKLPENYKSKISGLEFYESYEEDSSIDDLPF